LPAGHRDRLVTLIGFCDGFVKVDLFFQEAKPAADPWLRDGFRALVDPDGLADRLRRALAAEPPAPDLSDFDVHAWDWLWAMHLKLRRLGHEWLVYVEHVKFVETMLLTAFNALGPEPWLGVLRVDERLPAAMRSELVNALPTRLEDAELRRAVSAAVDSYLALRPRLAAERNMPLAEEVAQQVATTRRDQRAPPLLPRVGQRRWTRSPCIRSPAAVPAAAVGGGRTYAR
jgi:hypothetical protein